MTVYAKDPDSDIDYSFDWSSWLVPGETITNTEWAVTPNSGAPSLHSPVEADSRRGIQVAGGTAGSRYRLACRIETDSGRTGERSLSLRIMER